MKNKRGFTIVELVIVIAVVAVLAAVMIPTFSSIIRNANISSDTKTAREMNVILTAESADGTPPAGGRELIDALEANGFSKFRPQTKFFNFYWINDLNVIVLTNEDGDPVFPEEYVYERYNDSTWVNLADATGMQTLPPAPEETIEQPREFPVTLRISGGNGVTFDVRPTATEGQPFRYEFLIPIDPQNPNYETRIRNQIKKVSATMKNGDEVYNIDVLQTFDLETSFSVFDVPFVLDIPSVTGEIDIRVTIKEFCKVTVIGNTPEHWDEPEANNLWMEKGMRFHLGNHHLFEYMKLKDGYGITSAIVYVGEQSLGEAYDKEHDYIHSRNINVYTDMTVKLDTEWKAHKIQFVIRDNNSNPQIIYDQTQTASYDTEKGDIVASFVLPDELRGKELEITRVTRNPVPEKEEDAPIHSYDSESGTVTISNIKYNLTLTYFVNVKD